MYFIRLVRDKSLFEVNSRVVKDKRHGKIFHVQRNGHSWKWTKSIELNIKDKLYTVNTKLGHVGESFGHPMCSISPCFNLFSLSLHDMNPAAAAAAKSLQSCPTLCDPIDGSPPGSPVPGSLQARTL